MLRRNPWILWLAGGVLAIGVIVAMFFVGRTTASPAPEQVEVTRQVEVTQVVYQVVTTTPGVPTETPAVVPTTTPIATTAIVATNAAPALTPVPTSGAQPTTYGVFTPDWSALDPACPSTDIVLQVHGLTGKVTVVDHPVVSWEPCLVVVELKPEFRGTTIPLFNGYQYTAAIINGDVTTYWGGDPNVTGVTLQWGTTFRWGPMYRVVKEGQWMDSANPCELEVREYRFGRYRRNADSGQPDVPYFMRLGPYLTLPGNINCVGWVTPSLDEVVPRDYLQATAMLGGLANPGEWQHSSDMLNWSWKYSGKVAGSATYCPLGDPCWQTVYPPSGPGYVELWLEAGARGPGGTVVSTAGPYKFHASDLAILMDGFHNVDEFSYHADPNR